MSTIRSRLAGLAVVAMALAASAVSAREITHAMGITDLKASFPGAVVDAIGFKRPAPQDKDGFAEDLTRERIPELTADRIFYFSPDRNDAEAEANLADWIDDPLWLGLDAVKAGQTLRVDDGIWVAAGGIFAANIVLDDLEAVYGLASTR